MGRSFYPHSRPEAREPDVGENRVWILQISGLIVSAITETDLKLTASCQKRSRKALFPWVLGH